MKLFRWMDDEAHSHRCAALANDDAGVMQAKLTYQCAGHAVAHGNTGTTSTYAPVMPDVSLPTPMQPQVDRFGRITYSTNFGTPADTPCPHLNSAYGRGMIGSQLIMRRIAPNADTVCARPVARAHYTRQLYLQFLTKHRLLRRRAPTCNLRRNSSPPFGGRSASGPSFFVLRLLSIRVGRRRT